MTASVSCSPLAASVCAKMAKEMVSHCIWTCTCHHHMVGHRPGKTPFLPSLSSPHPFLFLSIHHLPHLTKSLCSQLGHARHGTRPPLNEEEANDHRPQEEREGMGRQHVPHHSSSTPLYQKTEVKWLYSCITHQPPPHPLFSIPTFISAPFKGIHHPG